MPKSDRRHITIKLIFLLKMNSLINTSIDMMLAIRIQRKRKFLDSIIKAIINHYQNLKIPLIIQNKIISAILIVIGHMIFMTHFLIHKILIIIILLIINQFREINFKIKILINSKDNLNSYKILTIIAEVISQIIIISIKLINN